MQIGSQSFLPRGSFYIKIFAIIKKSYILFVSKSRETLTCVQSENSMKPRKRIRNHKMQLLSSSRLLRGYFFILYLSYYGLILYASRTRYDGRKYICFCISIWWMEKLSKMARHNSRSYEYSGTFSPLLKYVVRIAVSLQRLYLYYLILWTDSYNYIKRYANGNGIQIFQQNLSFFIFF